MAKLELMKGRWMKYSVVNNGEDSDSQMEDEQGSNLGNLANDGLLDKRESLPSHTGLPAVMATPSASAIRDMGATIRQRLVYFEIEHKKANSKHRHLERSQT